MVPTRAESQALNDLKGPAIIVSASGMLTGGRILHHVLNRASHTQDSLILCGFQARGTRGRELADGGRTLKIFGQPTAIRMEVQSLASFSAHADQQGIIDWIAGASLPRSVLVNHGEPAAVSALIQAARARFGKGVEFEAASLGTPYELGD